MDKYTTYNHTYIQYILVIVIVISRLLKQYLKAKRTRAPAYSRALRRIKGVFPKGGQEKLRFRIPGGDNVAVKVGVLRLRRVNDHSAFCQFVH